MTEVTDGFTPEVLERIVHKALTEHDMQGVEYAMRLLAVRDPRRAELLLETMKVGLAIAAEAPRAEETVPAPEECRCAAPDCPWPAVHDLAEGFLARHLHEEKAREAFGAPPLFDYEVLR
jgi:hypothetical protein